VNGQPALGLFLRVVMELVIHLALAEGLGIGGAGPFREPGGVDESRNSGLHANQFIQLVIWRQSRFSLARNLNDTLDLISETKPVKEEGRYWPATFRERFCEYYKCGPEEFEQNVFWRTLHRHAYFLARWWHRRDPLIFKEDYDFIHEIGGVRDPLIFKSELNRYHGRNVRERGWIRGTLHVRVSGKRVIRLKNKIFGLSS